MSVRPALSLSLRGDDSQALQRAAAEKCSSSLEEAELLGKEATLQTKPQFTEPPPKFL